MARTVSRRDDARYRAAEDAVWESRGLTRDEHWVEVPELGIRVRAQVHGEGRPVVFVHGTPTAGDVFVPLVAALEGVRAIVIDRPGCGLSDPIDYFAMTPGRLAKAVRDYMNAVVDELVDGPTDLVGSSSGGMASLTFAALEPDKVRSLVLEGMPAVRQMRLPVPMRMALFPPLASAVVRHRFTERDIRQSFKQMGHGATLEAGAMPEVDLAWRVAVGESSDTFLHELQLLGRAATWNGPRPEWSSGPHTLENVQAPTLWLVGDQDPFAPRGGVEELVETMPRAVSIPRAGEGHLPWIDDPAGHADVIMRWWEGLDR